MKTSELMAFSAVAAIGVLSLFTNYHQHLLIKSYRGLVGSNILLRSDEYITRAVDSEDYVRGYHQATEDLGCPPSAEERNAAVDSWRKINLQAAPTRVGTSKGLDKKQDEIAERIKRAISPKPEEGK